MRGLTNPFQRRPAPPREVEAALADLEKVVAERPELAGPARFQAELLRVLWQGPSGAQAPTLQAVQGRTFLEGKVPVLRLAPPTLDPTALRDRAGRILGALREQQPSNEVRTLDQAIARKRLDLHLLTQEVLQGDPAAVAVRAEGLGLDPTLTTSVLRLALFPALAEVAAALAPLGWEQIWKEGYCPCCGSWPLLGEYRGLETSRFLRCGLCAAAWVVDRLFCPACQNRDHATLGYLAPEGEEQKWRATTCDLCQTYVKMRSSLVPLSPPALLVTDFVTLPLDMIALGRGYLPPT